MADTNHPPFATSGGKPITPTTGKGGGFDPLKDATGGEKGGGHDFLTDPKGSSEAAGGGRDFTKESRPQSEAKPEVVPNPQEIPKGGKILFADPGPVSAKVSGTAQHVEKKPFKL
jgi:hypothetical protein